MTRAAFPTAIAAICAASVASAPAWGAAVLTTTGHTFAEVVTLSPLAPVPQTGTSVDSDADGWGSPHSPRDLHASTSTNSFDTLGTVAGSNAMDATWGVGATSGTVGVDFQALFAMTDGSTPNGEVGRVEYYTSAPPTYPAAWEYEFTPLFNGVFELDYAFDDTLSTRGDHAATANTARILVNDVSFDLLSMPGVLNAFTFNLVAGTTYTVGLAPSIFGQSNISAVWTGTQTYSWSMIADPSDPTDPTDPGQPPVPGSVPEPATWAMMLVGFGVIGSAMRRPKARVAF